MADESVERKVARPDRVKEGLGEYSERGSDMFPAPKAQALPAGEMPPMPVNLLGTPEPSPAPSPTDGDSAA